MQTMHAETDVNLIRFLNITGSHARICFFLRYLMDGLSEVYSRASNPKAGA